MKRKPNCAPGGTLSKTRLASCSGGILAGSTGEYWRAAPARYWPETRQDLLSGILGGIYWRATLGYSAGCSAGSTGGCSGGILGGTTGELLTLAGYLAGSTGELWDTQRDTRRDPLAGCSGGILGGIHWRAALAGFSAAGSTGEPLWRAALARYLATSTGEPLWRDTRRDPLASWIITRQDPLASNSGEILGGIRWRAALVLGGMHWRAALAGYWVGSTGELLWRGVMLGGGVV